MIIFSLLFSSFNFRINYHSCKKENKTYASLFNLFDFRNHSEASQLSCCSHDESNCQGTCSIDNNHNHTKNYIDENLIIGEKLNSNCCTETEIEKSILLISYLDYSKIQLNKFLVINKNIHFFENAISKKVEIVSTCQLKHKPPLINYLIEFIKYHTSKSNDKDDFTSLF